MYACMHAYDTHLDDSKCSGGAGENGELENSRRRDDTHKHGDAIHTSDGRKHCVT